MLKYFKVPYIQPNTSHAISLKQTPVPEPIGYARISLYNLLWL